MISPVFLDGAPDWIDLGTPDLDGAAAFYGELFGWGLIPGGPEVGGYGMFTLDGRYVGGVMTVPEDQAPSAWSVSFQSPDVAATAAAVERAGGSAAFEPMDVLDFGSMGGFTDPAGAYFGVWQPKDHPGFGVVQEPNSFLWAELYTPDVPAAAAFYHRVFGWGTEELEIEGADSAYTTAHPAGAGPDASFGGLVRMGDVPAEAAAGRTGCRTSPWPTSTPPWPRPGGSAARRRWPRWRCPASAGWPTWPIRTGRSSRS